MVARVAHGAVSDFPDRLDSTTNSASVQDHGVEDHFSVEQQLDQGDLRASDGTMDDATTGAMDGAMDCTHTLWSVNARQSLLEGWFCVRQGATRSTAALSARPCRHRLERLGALPSLLRRVMMYLCVASAASSPVNETVAMPPSSPPHPTAHLLSWWGPVLIFAVVASLTVFARLAFCLKRKTRNRTILIGMTLLIAASIPLALYGYAVYDLDAIVSFDIMASYAMWNVVFVVDHMENVSGDMISFMHDKQKNCKDVLKVIWELTALVSTLLLTVAAANFGEDSLCNEENDCVGVPIAFLACNSMAFMQFLCGTLLSVIHTIYLTPLSSEHAIMYLEDQPGAPAAGLCWTCCGTGWLTIAFYILNSHKYGFTSSLYFVLATAMAAVVVAHTARRSSGWDPDKRSVNKAKRKRAKVPSK